MCALMVSRGRRSNPVLTMKPHFGGFTSVPPQKNDDFMAKMEKCCFLFAKNDYLKENTSIFSLK